MPFKMLTTDTLSALCTSKGEQNHQGSAGRTWNANPPWRINVHKKGESVTKICTPGLLGWGNSTLHPVISSECCGTLSAQREKGTSEGSSCARKSLVISTNVYGCLNLYGMYELWKKAGRIFILLRCRDLIYTFRTTNFPQFPYFSEEK